MSDDTREIKDKLDVVDLIQEYVQLKPAGTNHKGLCPFHNEKSPSFMVSRERQSWHCFGCGKGGDIFSFVQEMEGMEFVESLKYLAEKAGVQLTFKGGVGKTEEKARLKEACSEAARFYHNFLLKMDQASVAREYLQQRGITIETIETWNIGYIPDQWDLLTKYLLKKGHGIDDLVTAGLTIKRDNANPSTYKGYYDRFRGRIMFPIRDVHGAVVGFTGRVLVETEKSGGKYVNSPQTPIFDKSRLVFGLDLAKQAIKSKDLIVMCEGQMDVISVSQSGMKHVVASSGTAMTGQQIALLKRYSSNIAMAFDSDEAGIKAAKKGIQLAIRGGMHVKVIEIPKECGSDPDECVKKDPEQWQRCVQQAKDVMDWSFARVFSSGSTDTPQGRQKVVDALLPEIAEIPYAVERDHWLRELAQRVGVDVQVLHEDLKRFNNQDKKLNVSQVTETKEVAPVQKKQSRFDLLLERAFVLVLRYPDQKRFFEGISPQMVEKTQYGELYEKIKEAYTSKAAFEPAALDLTKDASQENIVDVLVMKGDLLFPQVPDIQKELEQTFHSLKLEWHKKQREVLTRELKVAEDSGDQDLVKKIIHQLQQYL